MKSLRKLVPAIFSLGVVFFGFGTKPAFAEENSITGLQISPVIERMELDPGANYSNNITIMNTGNEPIKFEMSASPYQVEDITYAPIYTVTNAYTQITNWITFDTYEDYLEPGEMSIVKYNINVPLDAPGGGQYAVIFAETKDVTGANESVRANTKTGMIVRAKISGVTRESGEIVSTKIPSFLLSPPVSVSATLKNDGNVDADLKMIMKIENYFSGELIYDGANDPLEKTILPGTTRDLDISWSNVPRLGVLKVTQNIEYLKDAEVKSRIVVICPIWFIALVVLIIFAIVLRVVARKHEERKTRKNSKHSEGGSGNFNL